MTERHIIPEASVLKGRRTSSCSGGDKGSCVEVLDHQPYGLPVRDSKAPQGPALVFGRSAWASFVSAVRAGEPDD